MQYTTIVLAATAALCVRAQTADMGPGPADSPDAYIADVCAPTNATGFPDLDAPCNQVAAISAQCIYGPSIGLGTIFGSDGSGLRKRQSSGDGGDISDEPAEQSNSTQRVCACESQFWGALSGCLACEKAHGSTEAEAYFQADLLSSMSSAYCAASATPTIDLADFLDSYPSSALDSISASLATASTSAFTDPIGNKTAVSLYYTPSVTGSAAWVVAEATGTASGSSSAEGTFSSVNSKDGQIVATAAGSAVGSASSGSAASGASGSSTSSSAGAGVATARPEAAAAIAGVVGFAGLVALL